MRAKLQELIKDKFLLASCIIAVALAISHGCNFAREQTVQTAGRLIFCAAFPFGALAWNRRYLFLSFPAFGYFLQHFQTLNNYSTFLIIMIDACYKPRLKWPMIAVYILNLAAICVIREKSWNFAQIHALNCVMIFCAFEFLLIKDKRVRLNLTADETRILDELAEGKQLKAVECFSKNTVTKKLTEARKRNGCLNNSELLYKYTTQKA